MRLLKIFTIALWLVVAIASTVDAKSFFCGAISCGGGGGGGGPLPAVCLSGSGADATTCLTGSGADAGTALLGQT